MQGRNVYWLITVQWLAHFADEFVFGEYSPVTASGVVFFLPLSLPLWRVVLREAEVTKHSLTMALGAGFVVHALVLLNSLVDKSAW